VMTYNEVTESFQVVPTAVNSVKRTVTAHVTRFSVFALMHPVTQDAEPPVPATPVTTPSATTSETTSETTYETTPATTQVTTPDTTTIPTPTESGMDFPFVGMLLVMVVLTIAGDLFRRR